MRHTKGEFYERVIKAREDDGEALKIVKSFEPLIKKCIGMYMKDKSSFEDAMQEGRITILRCIKNYDISSKVHFEGYVKMAVIYCIRGIASRHRENISLDEEIGEDGGSLHDILEDDVDIEGDTLKREEIRRLREALNNLTENQKSVIEEFYFEDKSMMEMAKGRRCHYMTVVKTKDRALESLRRMMG